MKRPDKNSPWVPAVLYSVAIGTLVLVGYVWYDLHYDMTDLALLVLVVWVLWLTLDRANLNDYAEQAADNADDAARQYYSVAEHHDKLVARFNELLDWLDEHHPDGEQSAGSMSPPTMPLPAQRVASSADVETRLFTREFSGQAFQFRAP